MNRFFITTILLASLSAGCEKADTAAHIKPAPALQKDGGVKFSDFVKTFAFIGRDIRQYAPSEARPTQYCPTNTSDLAQENPIDTIVKMAENHRVVIINEAHNRPRDRAFILKLAQALKPEGFNIFAAETFSRRDLPHEQWQAEIMDRNYVINNDGYYSNEPVFGQTINTVLGLGYRPVAYETETHGHGAENSIRRRELEQTKNLIKRALKKYLEQKILIHVGYSHARETQDSFGDFWMAYFLKKEMGIDPLTISQTNCTMRSHIGGLNYSAIVPNQTGGEADGYYDGYDVMLYPGETSFTKGRANWLQDIGRKFVDIPKNLGLNNKWAYVEARLTGEAVIDSVANQYGKGARAVAHDGVVVRPGENIALALAAGGYNLTAYDENKKIISTAKITVQ